jgi:hypothetical protein
VRLVRLPTVTRSCATARTGFASLTIGPVSNRLVYGLGLFLTIGPAECPSGKVVNWAGSAG